MRRSLDGVTENIYMPKNTKPADYIVPLNMNGLEGRMLHVPATRKSVNKEILLLYGHHALLERWWGLVENLKDYGSVTMPDLPGFGGMDSFAKIGIKPTIDQYADYLASFIQLRYKRRRITIAAISFGFVVATRLQKYPEIAKRVDLVVSIVGFMHHDDFHFSPTQRRVYSRVTKLFAKRPIAYVIRYGALNRYIIENLYVRLPAGKRRFLEMDPEEFSIMMDFEVSLWQSNDVSTHWATTSEFLRLDNCKSQIDLPVWHVASKYDHYFNNEIVEQHMRVVYRDYNQALMNSKAHTPSIIADKKGMSIMVPPKLRKALRER
jgi:pimeloyl-ACP methyl ester carboxylesterase